MPVDRHREFPVDPNTDAEPVTFTIADATFTCVPSLPAGAVRVLDGRRAGAAAAMAFIEAVLVADDVDRFVATINDRDTIIPAELLVEVFTWLTEVYTDRPTSPPSS